MDSLAAHMVERARSLRKNTTDAEKKLWYYLRGSSFAGLKFRRQHPIGPYVADFCCPQEKLIIELDGDSHIYTTDKDNARTEYLNQQGYRVIRFLNEDVLHHVEPVLVAIARELNLDWDEAVKKSNWKRNDG